MLKLCLSLTRPRLEVWLGLGTKPSQLGLGLEKEDVWFKIMDSIATTTGRNWLLKQAFFHRA